MTNEIAPPLWTCRACNRSFANRNQTHSCSVASLATFLRQRPAGQLHLFERFFEAVKACGDVSLAPAKTRVGFQARMIFAAVNRLSDVGLDAHVVLSRRVDHPRLRRVEAMSPRCFVHHFRIAHEDEIDAEVCSWLKEAYEVGTQREVLRRRSARPKSRVP